MIRENKFGFFIHADNQIDLEKGDYSLSEKIAAIEPGFRTCISCGSCAASCTAGTFTDFNFRRICHDIRIGRPEKVKGELSKCMFCGKCRLICPRGINTRKIISVLYKELFKTGQYAY